MHRARFERIAIFRALQLGDLLVAVPAMRALRTAFPRAHLTLIALPWASELVPRLPWLDDFLAFPGHPALPERAPEPGALAAFFTRAAQLHFDLAIQLHGSGEITNGIVARLGARQVAGFHPDGAACPDPRWFVTWPDRGREAERLLGLPLHLGAAQTSLALEFALCTEDRAETERLWGAAGGRAEQYICVHPGARLRSRRWPAERFAQVAEALRGKGLRVVLTGSAGDAQAVSGFRAALGEPIVDVSGRTSLGGLAAMIADARLLLSNDTGVAHLAAALRTPSVIVCSGADAQRWAPLDQRRHRMLHHDTACRPCSYEQCPTGHECALGVSAGSVLAECERQLDPELRYAA
jgi:ADP-heptose:LPS heptosyltransferase